MQKEKKKIIDPYVCPFCGANLIHDPAGLWVCPVCGAVVSYDVLPSIRHLEHTAPADETMLRGEQLTEDQLNELKKVVGENVVKRLASNRRGRRILRIAYDILHGRRVSWRDYRDATEALKTPAVIREARRKEVKKEIQTIIEKTGIDLDPEEVFNIALKHEAVWAGRKAKTVAVAFVYAIARIKGINIELSAPDRIKRLASLIYNLLIHEMKQGKKNE